MAPFSLSNTAVLIYTFEYRHTCLGGPLTEWLVHSLETLTTTGNEVTYSYHDVLMYHPNQHVEQG